MPVMMRALLPRQRHTLVNGVDVGVGSQLGVGAHIVVRCASAIPPESEVVGGIAFGQTPLNRSLHFIVAFAVQVLGDLGRLAQLLFGNGQERQHVGYCAGYFGQHSLEFRRKAEGRSPRRLIFGGGAAASARHRCSSRLSYSAGVAAAGRLAQIGYVVKYRGNGRHKIAQSAVSGHYERKARLSRVAGVCA